ncbi:hypothetical protein V6B33_11300 [Mangrovibacillus sp. Mu-81]|uniref:hypothetical protein n=1 Tax=Mangrovibacillus sp. Mu-81 TaxID=3121478 RepID=UPI002FE4B15D
MENWIGKVGIVFIVVGIIGGLIALNGVDWDAYDFAKEMAEYDDLESLTQVAMYRGMINAAILTALSGGAVGTLLIGIGMLIDIGRERNELIRKQSGDLENAS